MMRNASSKPTPLKSEKRVEAVERALSILEAFSTQHMHLTLAQLAEETGLYKSTILRLSASLIRYGYLVKYDNGTYGLGPSLWRLGSLYRLNFDLGVSIRPELRFLVQETGETASFYVRHGAERLCLYRENSPNLIRYHLEEGNRLDLKTGASGRILSYFAEDIETPDIELGPYASYIAIGERDPEMSTVAIAVFGSHGDIKGSLSISGLTSRFNADKRQNALELLHAAARKLQPHL